VTPTRSRWYAAARAAVVVVAALLLSRGISAPFVGWHELNSAMYSQFARNHIQYGLGYTRLYCTWGETAAPPAVPDRYLNHPPLICLWTAVPLVVFGDHEWAARLVPIAATLGSVVLLMRIVGGLGGPLLGVLAGFFFATVPLTAYFGRMIDHVAPVQFFTLLMLHGYLQWTGLPPGAGRSRLGAVWYVTGAVLGIGTGWAAVLAAFLLCAWHVLRVARGSGEARRLPWLAGAPAAALAAVVLHMLAGSGWDLTMLPALLAGRSLGGVGGAQTWSEWLSVQWVHFTRNFTLPGAIAALACAGVLLARLVRPNWGEAARRFPLRGGFAATIGLTGLHGILYVALFKNAAWFHDYWQFFLGPFVAVSLASLTAMAFAAVRPRAPRLAPVVVAVLLLLPVPWTAASFAFYAAQRQPFAEHVEALRRLRDLVPPRAPVWVSRQWSTASETIGGFVSRRTNAVVAYYADRPLLYSRDAREVEENRPGCAAYLLLRRDTPWARELEAALSRSHATVPVGPDHVIFLLGR
jgi:Dolichyl-phosphate-mannose-protein mannosyltransferase